MRQRRNLRSEELKKRKLIHYRDLKEVCPPYLAAVKLLKQSKAEFEDLKL
jgi:hypothetical protein